MDHSRFYRGLFQAVWLIQRPSAYPPRPFPQGRGARLGAVRLSTPSLPSHEHFAAKEFSLVPRSAPPFPLRLLVSCPLWGDEQNCTKPLLRSLTRPKKTGDGAVPVFVFRLFGPAPDRPKAEAGAGSCNSLCMRLLKTVTAFPCFPSNPFT